MALAILNSEGFKDLSQYSGNPFLDAMTDLQGVVDTVITYQQHKPYIDKYSDTSLSDLKDKIKANLPEALNQDGSINFSKLEELASNGNPLAEHILTIKQHRENFSNAPIIGKIAAIKNETVSDILSGNKLTKEANVLKKMQKLDEFLKNNKNIPEDVKMLLSLNKEAFLGNPEVLAYLSTIFTNQQPSQGNNNQQTNTQQNTDQQSIQNNNTSNSNNSSEADYIKSIIENNPSQTPTSEADYIKSIIENNPSITPKKKKQVIAKLKQIVETKKKQKTSNNNQPTIEQFINNPFKQLSYISTQSQQQAQTQSQTQSQSRPKTRPKTQSQNDNSILSLFLNSIFHPSSRVMFSSINDIIKGK